MKRTFALVLIIVFFVAGSSAAGIPDYDNCYCSIAPAATGASVIILPNGSGSSFLGGHAPGGAPVDATITLHVLDGQGLPIVNYPAVDIWLETTGGSLAHCPYGTVADHDTDGNGETVWQDPLLAGGCTWGEEAVVVIGGVPMTWSTVPITFVSPDIDGSLMVNLSDVVTFASGLFTYSPCADFNNDGTVDLSDIVVMAAGIGAACP